MLVLFFCLVAKWARRTESAFYFTGASIRESSCREHDSCRARTLTFLPRPVTPRPVALICIAAMYITITLPSIRIIARCVCLDPSWTQPPGDCD